MNLPTKSRFAFECSSAKIPANRKGNLYFWTFTFPTVLDLREARAAWSKFLKLFRRQKKYFRFNGLRVFEMHENHGLHVHVITANFLWVNDVRALWRSVGGGRIHVKPIPFERRNYVAKYLTKSGRPECLKGARLWAAFGDFDNTRIKDVVIDSPFTRVYNTLSASIRVFKHLKWWIRQGAVLNVLAGKPWHVCLHNLVPESDQKPDIELFDGVGPWVHCDAVFHGEQLNCAF